MIMVLLFQGENFGEAVAFWMQPQGLKGNRLAREWKRINRCRIIARSSGINHFLNRAVPTLFWATADIFNAFGPVLHKKLIKIVTGMAKELICYPNAGQLANEVCYRVVKHLVSFKFGARSGETLGIFIHDPILSWGMDFHDSDLLQ